MCFYIFDNPKIRREMNDHFTQRRLKSGLVISLWQQFSGSLFLLLFGGVFLYFLVPEVWSYGRALSWSEASCTILSSKVKRITDPGWKPEVKPVHYQPVITYSYTFNNTRYLSSKYTFINPSTTGTRADEITAKYPKGSTAICYVNPAKPKEAVLNRTFTAFSFVIFVPLPFFLLGIWGMTRFLRNVYLKLNSK